MVTSNASQCYVVHILPILYDVVPSASPPCYVVSHIQILQSKFCVSLSRDLCVLRGLYTQRELFTSNGTPYNTKCVDVFELQ
jgi:hypothetical protein